MSEKTEEQQVLAAVEEYAYRRHMYINTANVWGFSDEELSRIKTHDGGYLVFTIEDVHVDETEEEDGETTWYVSATVVFQVDDDGEPFETDPDIYRCKRDGDGDGWDIEWHAS